jgi:hypothetical protein
MGAKWTKGKSLMVARIFCIDGHSKHSLEAGYHVLRQVIQANQSIADTVDTLSRSTKQWLIVLDNADD